MIMNQQGSLDLRMHPDLQKQFNTLQEHVERFVESVSKLALPIEMRTMEAIIISMVGWHFVSQTIKMSKKA